jgi:hypothetical protein
MSSQENPAGIGIGGQVMGGQQTGGAGASFIQEPLNAFVTFKIAPENLQEVLYRLVELGRNPPEGIVINKIVPVAGRLDCVLDVTAATPDDHFLFVTEDLGKIRGITSVESLVGNENWLNYVAATRSGGTPQTVQGQQPQPAPWGKQMQQQQPYYYGTWAQQQQRVQGSRAARYRQAFPH